MSTPRTTTVVTARFSDLLAAGLGALLDGDASIETVAAGIEQGRMSVVIGGHRPDVAILDTGALHELAEVQRLAELHPGTSFVLLGPQPSVAECAQLLAFGASACLGSDTQARDVLNAVHLASRGLRVTQRSSDGPGAHEALAVQLLTPRESEVLPLLREGLSNAQIALSLAVGIETIRTHTRNIYRKLGVTSRRALLANGPARGAPDHTPPRAPRHRAPMRTRSPHRARGARPG